LSGIDAATNPALSIGATAVTQSGSTAWDDGNWPKATVSWSADVAGLCFDTTAPLVCVGGPTDAAINAAFADGSQTRRATVPLSRAGCASGLPPYTMVAQDGGIFAPSGGFFGTASIRRPDPVIHGPDGTGWLSPLGRVLQKPVVGMAYDATGNGYWVVTSDGVIYPVGDAPSLDDLHAIKLNKPIVGIVPTPTRLGYYLIASDGGVFCFGDAKFAGSLGSLKLNKPIVGGAADPDGRGYYLVAEDGGVFAIDAVFHGSLGRLTLAQPIVGMALKPGGGGYVLAGADGGAFAFGTAAYRGSLPALRVKVAAPVVGIASDPDGSGYWMAGADGGAFAFDALFAGGVAHLLLNSPMTGIVAR
jgi:hypothetical protein